MLDYDLDKLGWFEFERLVQVLLKSNLGLGIESWGGSGDWGRDAYFEGEISTSQFIQKNGRFLFQFKFVDGANAAGANPYPALQSAVSTECSRIGERESKGLPQPTAYIFVTNSPLIPDERSKICSKIQKVLPNSQVVTWSGKDTCDLIHLNEGIARRFPQLLGIRDLRALLRECVQKEIIERSHEAIKEAEEVSPVFVPTHAFSEAMEKLNKHKFVVLEGPPEVGKTSIARMIGISMMPTGWEIHETQEPADILKVYDPDAQQVYISDDSFGRTEYDPSAVHQWQRELPTILRKLNRDHVLILTSRKHLLEMAKSRLDIPGDYDRFPDLGEVVVDVASIKDFEKALMLYKHSKNHRLSGFVKEGIRRFALTIIRHGGFSPERIRSFVKDVSLLSNENDLSDLVNMVGSLVQDHFAQPTRRMRKAFDALLPHYQWLLISLLALGGSARCESGSFKELETEYDSLCPSEVQAPFRRTMSELSESFVKTIQSGESSSILTWVHPTWGDMISEVLQEDPQLRIGFLERATSTGLRFAVSSGGGRFGKVVFPLVKTANEWRLFEDRLNNLQGPASKLLIDLVDISSRIREDEKFLNLRQRLEPLIRRTLLPSVIQKNNSEGWTGKELADFLDLAAKADLETDGIDYASGWLSATNVVVKEMRSNLVAFQAYDSIERFVKLTEKAKEKDPQFLLQDRIREEWEGVIGLLEDWGEANSESCEVNETHEESIVEEAERGYRCLSFSFYDIGYSLLEGEISEDFQRIGTQFSTLAEEAEGISGIEEEEEEWNLTEEFENVKSNLIIEIFSDL